MKKATKQWYDAAILKEDEQLTTAKSKHFILNNGTRKAVFSASDINYFDKAENKWKAVDNSLKSTGAGYQGKLGNYTVTLSNASGSESVEVSDGDSTISWKYLGTHQHIFAKQLGKASAPAAKRQSKLKVHAKLQDSMKLHTAGQAVFQGADGDVDLDYRIEGNSIKENIVVKDKSESYSYYFTLHVSGFTMKPSEDGKEIAFFKVREDPEETETAEKAEEPQPDFVMQSPCMSDSAGNASDSVQYKMESAGDGDYIFSVNADSEWINAPERVFPVQIDPHLSLSGTSYLNITQTQYLYQSCSSCTSGEWCVCGYTSYDYISLKRNANEKETTTVRIKRNQIDLSRNKVISAKLIFERYGNESKSIYTSLKIGNQNINIWEDRDLPFEADITSLYKSGTGDFYVNIEVLTTGRECKFKSPKLEIEYQQINSLPAIKNLSVAAGVTAELDVLSGYGALVLDDISDPALGVSVSHVYKPNNEFTEYGKNFRLNLDEKLVKLATTTTGAEYVYTDPSGNKHTFKEHFYKIGANGEKIAVTANVSSILADSNGQLWLGNEQVFRELTTVRGLRATARLEGVNNAEWLEQRIDEEKQLEEQVKSYENTLTNFVLVHKEDGHTTDTLTYYELSNPDAYETFIKNRTPCCSYLLTQEEALSYRSLLTQRKSLMSSQTALSLQQESLKYSAKELCLQYYSPDTIGLQTKSDKIQESLLRNRRSIVTQYLNKLKNEKKDETDPEFHKYALESAVLGDSGDSSTTNTEYGLLAKQKSVTFEQSDSWAKRKELLASQINRFSLGSDYKTSFSSVSGLGTLTKQFNNVSSQIAVINQQLVDTNRQISLLAQKSEKYIEQLNTLYKEYRNLKNRFELLKLQIPVSYLIGENAVKGYNSKGQLVLIQDKHGNYAAVEREFYSPNKNRISAVYDQNNNTMRFGYNGAHRLSEIVNSIGSRTAFRYDSNGKLVAIEREALPSLTLAYSSDLIQKITASNNCTAAFSYNLTKMLTGITRNTTVTAISHDKVDTQAAAVKLSTVTIDYHTNLVYIHTDGVYRETFDIDNENDRVSAYYQSIYNTLTSAEQYTYSRNCLVKKESATKFPTDAETYVDFDFARHATMVENITYNSFDEPIMQITENYNFPRTANASPAETIQTEYTYNTDRKLICARSTRTNCEFCDSQAPEVTVKKYAYNTSGDLVRTESYMEGEELREGIQIEEHVYNDKGMEIQSFTYNSLDPSSKFYTESKLDEAGRTIATLDDTGKHQTTYEYERDGVSVKTEQLPNGSSFSYGRAKDGTVTAITHSTSEGVENSTRKVCTADLVTEIQSGNNTVQYTYDSKSRVTGVSLNGVDKYVSLTYNDILPDNNTVVATVKNQTKFTCIKNARGNVKELSCDNMKVTNTYDTSDQKLKKTVDSVSGITSYQYDAKDRLSTVTSSECNESYHYNEDNTLQQKTLSNNGNDFNHTYKYGYKLTGTHELDSIIVNEKIVKLTKDPLGRITGKSIEEPERKIAEEKISYIKFGDHATNLPATVRYANTVNGKYAFRESIQYRYDCMGNITEVFENGISICRYEYDSIGRLIREDNKDKAFNYTRYWVYDNNGNILARYELALTTTPTNELNLLDSTCTQYTYADNSDQLLSYGTKIIEYDNLIGNPTKYLGNEVEWQFGRRLTKYGNTTFAYDARGRRTRKTEGNDSIAFTYDSNGNLLKQSNGLEFLYDHTGLFAVKQGNSTYYYRKSPQNDIISLLDKDGTVVVKYRYDAWGVCKVLDATGKEITDANNIGNLNPFRYRSYYYDTETKLYFLQSRYYDPEVGRFITIDDISYLDPDSINGLNLYAYCLNNPVMFSDESGHSIIGSLVIGFVIGALIGGITGAVSGLATGQRGWALFGSILAGALTSGVLGAVTTLGGLFGIGAISVKWLGVGLLSSVAASFGVGVGAYYIKNAMANQETNRRDAIGHGIATAIQGLYSFGVGALMGASGNWTSLNKSEFSNNIKVLHNSGHSAIKSLVLGSIEFLKNNAGQMAIRAYMKAVLATPWSLLKFAF